MGTTHFRVVAVARARGLLLDAAALPLARQESSRRKAQAEENAAWEAGVEGGTQQSQQQQHGRGGSKGKIVPIGVVNPLKME